MMDALNSVLSAARLGAFIGASAIFFTLGVVAVCRLMKWAPVNITIHNYPPSENSTESSSHGAGARTSQPDTGDTA